MISVAASPAPEVPSTSYDGLGEALDEEIAQIRAESRLSAPTEMLLQPTDFASHS